MSHTMSSTRPRWSDDLTPLELAVEEESYCNQAAGSKRSMVLLYNCVLKNPAYYRRSLSRRESALDALELPVDAWPRALHHGILLDFRELAVPLQPGLSVQDRTANVLVCVLAIVRGNPQLTTGWSTMCSSVSKPKDALLGFHRSSASVILDDVSDAVFSEFDDAVTLSVDDLARVQDISVAILTGLGNAALLSKNDVREHMNSTGRFSVKPYERERERAREMLRNVQRVMNNVKHSPNLVPMVHCPVQLGYTDMRQWASSADDCRTGSAGRGLADLLNTACSCGLVTWKHRCVDGQQLSQDIPMKEWIPVVIHQLKEQVMQRFLRGAVVLDIHGHIQPDGDDVPYSLVEVDRRCSSFVDIESVRHHVCFVLPVADVSNFARERAGPTENEHQKGSKARDMLTAALLEQGEFQMSLKWEGVGSRLLRLHGKVKAVGRVRVLVGEYCGPEHYSVATLQRLKRASLISGAMRAFLGTHCASKDSVSLQKPPLAGIDVADVESALSSGVALPSFHKLSFDQSEMVRFIGQSTSGCNGVRAVAGAGKTITVTGMLLHEIKTLLPRQIVLWLVKSRKMRDEQLDLFRSYLSNPLTAVALGRRRDEGAKGDDVDEWDASVAAYLDTQLGSMIREMETLQAELLAVPEDICILTCAGKEWKRKSERMHRLSIELYAAKRSAMDAIFSNVKVIVMTVDGYVQLASGLAANSGLMSSLTVDLCVVDEAHQVDLTSIVPVVGMMDYVLMLWDPAQKIDFDMQNNAFGVNSLLHGGDYYAWERAVHGGSTTPVWTCLPEGHIFSMPYSWRFGSELCKFLRLTSGTYAQSSFTITSPKDAPRKFSMDELARVPDTRLRFVLYHKDRYYISKERGIMMPDPQLVFPRTSTVASFDILQHECRIAGSTTIFMNMIHEGLCFLKELAEGRIQLNTKTDPIKLEPTTKAIVTMIYGNDVLINFDATLIQILRNERVLRSYGLPENVDYLKVWSTGTPELVSGATVLLSQVAHFPRVPDCADLQGNLKDAGRRTVSASRCRIACSFHSCAECFENTNVPSSWKVHVQHVLRKPICASCIDSLVVDGADTPLASVGGESISGIDESAAFRTLQCTIGDLREFVHAIYTTNPDFAKRYRRHDLSTMLQQMLVVAEGYIAEVTEPQDVGQYNSVNSGSCSSDSCADDDGPMCNRERWDIDEYKSLRVSYAQCTSLLPHVLRTVSYVFGKSHGQVVPMILHRTAEHDEDVKTHMVELQRVVLVCCATLYRDDIVDDEHVRFVSIPHKVRQLAGHTVHDCWSDREAHVLCAMSAPSSMKMTWLSYAYLGGGVPWDPPFGYGLVYKHMPIRVADRLLAVLLFCSGGAVDPKCFVCKSADDREQASPSGDRDALIQERAEAVAGHIRDLNDKFDSVNSMLRFCGFPLGSDGDSTSATDTYLSDSTEPQFYFGDIDPRDF